jgi:hypothetical protein
MLRNAIDIRTHEQLDFSHLELSLVPSSTIEVGELSKRLPRPAAQAPNLVEQGNNE